jgi:hypothetical protein
MSGGDGFVAAEADERLFQAVQDVTARYNDALVADLKGEPRRRECVSRFLPMNWKLLVYGWQSGMNMEVGACRCGRRVVRSQGRGGLSAVHFATAKDRPEKSPLAVSAAVEDALVSARIRNPGATCGAAPRRRCAAPPRTIGGVGGS